jgi:ribosomal protein L17
MSKGKQNTAIAIVGKGLFNDIDFASLNKAIDSLGGASKTLTSEEKTAGTDIIHEWEDTVIRRLRNKNTEMRNIVYFFSAGNLNMNIFDKNQLAALAVQTETDDMYQVILDYDEEIADLNAERPERPDHDLNLSELQNLLNGKEYEMAMLKFTKRVGAIELKRNKAIKEWKKALIKDDSVKEMVAKASEYDKSLDTAINQCKEKSQIARLNVMIGNDDVRASLRELLNFSENI